MLTVKRFLCFKLETGGRIIGWINFIGFCLFALMAFCGATYLSISKCSVLEEIGGKSDYDSKMEKCNKERLGKIMTCSTAVVQSVMITICAWLCLEGIKTRDSHLLRPLMVLFGFISIPLLIAMFSETGLVFLIGMVSATILLYTLVVLYSLYKLFLREEYEDRVEMDPMVLFI